ncbi:MAG: tRNA dihydrouridine synthase DusB [Candidatus Omnitrophica bacterium]|nr:tRNA dihydrouridine synthase DusB [Candidatus Omnitrophota bacterium]
MCIIRAMLKIGSVSIKSKLILAPLSGTTDLPFRAISRAHGCKFAFYEMLDSSGLAHNHKRTLKMMESAPDDTPIGAQILGSDPDMILESCQIILEHSKPVLIDLNCACPAKKVIRKKAGSYLLKEPKKCAKIIKKMASSLPVPITVKLRARWAKNKGSEGLVLAKIAQDNGAKAVFFHGRDVTQGYAGKVDYEAIREIKKALKIPLIASGDILNAKLAQQMLDMTGCDGLLVARGAMGNPWIFSQIEACLKNEWIAPPSYEDVKAATLKHLELYRQWRIDREKRHNEKYYIGHLRKIAMWYTKGLPYSKRGREAISAARNYEEVAGVISNAKLRSGSQQL